MFNRRDSFLKPAGCGAYLLGALALAPAGVRTRFANQEAGRIVSSEPFSRLEELGEGIWALVSTPLQERTTLSNGGITAGSDGVLIGEVARAAFERGNPRVEVAAEYSLPESLGEWFMFSRRYHEVAFTAWHRELAG